MEIFKEFGIKPDLLLAQVINFLILLFILRKFLYAPVLRLLKKRKDLIEKSLKDAAEIESRLSKIGLEREEKLQEASLEAHKIVDKATKNAELIIQEAHERAQKDMERLAEKTRANLEVEKAKMFSQLKSRIADLVVMSFENVAPKVISTQNQKELVMQGVRELNK